MTTERTELSQFTRQTQAAANATRGLVAGISRLVLPVLGVTTAMSLLSASGLGGIIGNSGAVRNALLRVQDAIETLAEPFTLWIAEKLLEFADWLNTPEVQEAGRRFFQGIVDFAEAAGPIVGAVLGVIWDAIRNIWQVSGAVIESLGGWAGIFQGIGAAIGVAVDAMRTFWGWIARALDAVGGLADGVARLNPFGRRNNAPGGEQGGFRPSSLLNLVPQINLIRRLPFIGGGGGEPSGAMNNTTINNNFLAPSVEQQYRWSSGAIADPTVQSRLNGGS